MANWWELSPLEVLNNERKRRFSEEAENTKKSFLEQFDQLPDFLGNAATAFNKAMSNFQLPPDAGERFLEGVKQGASQFGEMALDPRNNPWTRPIATAFEQSDNFQKNAVDPFIGTAAGSAIAAGEMFRGQSLGGQPGETTLGQIRDRTQNRDISRETPMPFGMGGSVEGTQQAWQDVGQLGRDFKQYIGDNYGKVADTPFGPLGLGGAVGAVADMSNPLNLPGNMSLKGASLGKQGLIGAGVIADPIGAGMGQIADQFAGPALKKAADFTKPAMSGMGDIFAGIAKGAVEAALQQTRQMDPMSSPITKPAFRSMAEMPNALQRQANTAWQQKYIGGVQQDPQQNPADRIMQGGPANLMDVVQGLQAQIDDMRQRAGIGYSPGVSRVLNPYQDAVNALRNQRQPAAPRQVGPSAEDLENLTRGNLPEDAVVDDLLRTDDPVTGRRSPIDNLTDNPDADNDALNRLKQNLGRQTEDPLNQFAEDPLLRGQDIESDLGREIAEDITSERAQAFDPQTLFSIRQMPQGFQLVYRDPRQTTELGQSVMKIFRRNDRPVFFGSAEEATQMGQRLAPYLQKMAPQRILPEEEAGDTVDEILEYKANPESMRRVGEADEAQADLDAYENKDAASRSAAYRRYLEMGYSYDEASNLVDRYYPEVPRPVAAKPAQSRIQYGPDGEILNKSEVAYRPENIESLVPEQIPGALPFRNQRPRPMEEPGKTILEPDNAEAQRLGMVGQATANLSKATQFVGSGSRGYKPDDFFAAREVFEDVDVRGKPIIVTKVPISDKFYAFSIWQKNRPGFDPSNPDGAYKLNYILDSTDEVAKYGGQPRWRRENVLDYITNAEKIDRQLAQTRDVATRKQLLKNKKAWKGLNGAIARAKMIEEYFGRSIYSPADISARAAIPRQDAASAQMDELGLGSLRRENQPLANDPDFIAEQEVFRKAYPEWTDDEVLKATERVFQYTNPKVYAELEQANNEMLRGLPFRGTGIRGSEKGALARAAVSDVKPYRDPEKYLEEPDVDTTWNVNQQDLKNFRTTQQIFSPEAWEIKRYTENSALKAGEAKVNVGAPMRDDEKNLPKYFVRVGGITIEFVPSKGLNDPEQFMWELRQFAGKDGGAERRMPGTPEPRYMGDEPRYLEQGKFLIWLPRTAQDAAAPTESLNAAGRAMKEATGAGRPQTTYGLQNAVDIAHEANAKAVINEQWKNDVGLPAPVKTRKGKAIYQEQPRNNEAMQLAELALKEQFSGGRGIKFPWTEYTGTAVDPKSGVAPKRATEIAAELRQHGFVIDPEGYIRYVAGAKGPGVLTEGLSVPGRTRESNASIMKFEDSKFPADAAIEAFGAYPALREKLFAVKQIPRRRNENTPMVEENRPEFLSYAKEGRLGRKAVPMSWMDRIRALGRPEKVAFIKSLIEQPAAARQAAVRDMGIRGDYDAAVQAGTNAYARVAGRSGLLRQILNDPEIGPIIKANSADIAESINAKATSQPTTYTGSAAVMNLPSTTVHAKDLGLSKNTSYQVRGDLNQQYFVADPVVAKSSVSKSGRLDKPASLLLEKIGKDADGRPTYRTISTGTRDDIHRQAAEMMTLEKPRVERSDNFAPLKDDLPPPATPDRTAEAVRARVRELLGDADLRTQRVGEEIPYRERAKQARLRAAQEAMRQVRGGDSPFLGAQ